MRMRRPLIERHDVIDDDCPKYLKATLARIGGYNIYNEPTFRMVRAEKCFIHISIERPFFGPDQDPTNAIPMKDVADLMAAGVPEVEALEEGMAISARNLKPLRTEIGETLFPKYPFKGIVIERWQPPSFYGTRAEWESVHVAQFPFLGAYPQYGDYSLIASREKWECDECKFQVLLSLDAEPKCPVCKGLLRMYWVDPVELTKAIRHYREVQKTQPENPYTRFLVRAHSIMTQAARKERQLEEYYQNHLSDEWTGRCGLLNRVSLAAGRYRNEVAKRAGITEHAGN